MVRHLRYSPAAAPTSSRNLAMSLVGVLPKKRPHSLLNCEALAYPTCRLAVPASIIGDNIRRLASARHGHCRPSEVEVRIPDRPFRQPPAFSPRRARARRCGASHTVFQDQCTERRVHPEVRAGITDVRDEHRSDPHECPVASTVCGTLVPWLATVHLGENLTNRRADAEDTDLRETSAQAGWVHPPII